MSTSRRHLGVCANETPRPLYRPFCLALTRLHGHSRVKRGFARNFLIPQGLANYSLEAKVVADDEIDSQPQEILQETIEADQSQRVANFLAKHKLKMVRQSGNSWAINAEMLSQKCAKQFQLDVPSERIQLEAPLMTFGEHKVPVMVDDETPSELNVDVVRR